MADAEMQGYEDVTLYQLSDEREQELLRKQIECNFIWTNKAGHGLGVIMNYVARNGSIWVTATSQRARVKALRRDPRASVVISSMGTDMGPGKTITYMGRVIIHDDQATKDWFYPAMAGIISPVSCAYGGSGDQAPGHATAGDSGIGAGEGHQVRRRQYFQGLL